MDRLTAVRVFVEVVDRGSLTQTAEHLDMSAAMVSRYLVAIEDWFGARLLHRTTRKISLTDAGMAALPSCRQLLDLAQEAQHMAAERMREPAGVLRVTTASSFADAQLTAALVEFQAQYEQVEIVLSVGDKAADLVSERVDLAVRITNKLDPTMIARPLASCRSVLCASPSYLARHDAPQTAADLHQHRCIGHAFGIGKQYNLSRHGEVVQAPVNWRFQTNETAVLRRAVLSGAGPPTMWAKTCAQGAWCNCCQTTSPRSLASTRSISLGSTSRWPCACWLISWPRALPAKRHLGIWPDSMHRRVHLFGGAGLRV